MQWQIINSKPEIDFKKLHFSLFSDVAPYQSWNNQAKIYNTEYNLL